MKMMKFDEKYAHFNYYQWNSCLFPKKASPFNASLQVESLVESRARSKK